MSRQALGKGLDALLKQTQEVLNNPTVSRPENTVSGPSVQKLSLEKIIPNR